MEISRSAKPYKGIAMEGMLATWYARNTGKSLAEFRAIAKRIASGLRPDSSVLEIAPGPGYLAIELARLGSYRIAGVDISRTFVQMAAEKAERAGVDVDFRQGDAAALPFADGCFDFVVCRAAFKNFGDPVAALREMHRVLRPGGTALIIDMRNNASDVDIGDEVAKMRLGRFGGFITRTTLQMLRRRAYSKDVFAQMIAATPFGHAEISEVSIGFEISLVK